MLRSFAALKVRGILLLPGCEQKQKHGYEDRPLHVSGHTARLRMSERTASEGGPYIWCRLSLVETEVDFERDDDGHWLAVGTEGRLAAPGLQGLNGVVIEAKSRAFDHAEIGELAFEVHDSFD